MQVSGIKLGVGLSTLQDEASHVTTREELDFDMGKRPCDMADWMVEGWEAGL